MLHKYSSGFVHLIIVCLIICVVSIGVIGYSVFSEQPRINIISMSSPFDSSTVSPAVNAINDGEIYFTNKEKLYVFDTVSMQKRQLNISLSNQDSGNIDLMSFSSDGKYLYFARGEGFNIYDLDSLNLVTLKLGLNPAVEDSSNNGKYIIVDVGCCPGNREKYLLTVQGKLLKQLSGVNAYFSQDSNLIALTKSDLRVDAMNLDLPSIYIINIQDLVEKNLLESDYQTSYLAIGWDDNNSLIYKRTNYPKSFEPVAHMINANSQVLDPWFKNYSQGQDSYWTFDISNNKMLQFSRPDKPSSGEVFNKMYSPSRRWKLEVEDGIYAIDTQSLDKVKIGDGNAAVWKTKLN